MCLLPPFFWVQWQACWNTRPSRVFWGPNLQAWGREAPVPQSRLSQWKFCCSVSAPSTLPWVSTGWTWTSSNNSSSSCSTSSVRSHSTTCCCGRTCAPGAKACKSGTIDWSSACCCYISCGAEKYGSRCVRLSDLRKNFLKQGGWIVSKTTQ